MNKQIVLGVLCVVLSTTVVAKTYSAYVAENNTPNQRIVVGANANGDQQSTIVDQNGNLRMAPAAGPQPNQGQGVVQPGPGGSNAQGAYPAQSNNNNMQQQGSGNGQGGYPPSQSNNMMQQQGGGNSQGGYQSPQSNNMMQQQGGGNSQGGYQSPQSNNMMQQQGDGNGQGNSMMQQQGDRNPQGSQPPANNTMQQPGGGNPQENMPSPGNKMMSPPGGDSSQNTYTPPPSSSLTQSMNESSAEGSGAPATSIDSMEPAIHEGATGPTAFNEQKQSVDPADGIESFEG